jgi:hypothetical protein
MIERDVEEEKDADKPAAEEVDKDEGGEGAKFT